MRRELSQKRGTPEGFKSIPATRDRIQSDLLVGACGMLLVLKTAFVSIFLHRLGSFPTWFWIACIVSTTLALLVWRLRSATGPAALLGGLICWHLLSAQRPGTGWWQTALPALLLLFALTFVATRFGRRHKERLGMAEPRTGRRAAQIVANLGLAGLCAGASSPLLFLACVAALAEATADTVSSEIGQVLGRTTVLFTTGRRVPPGTDGGISLAGTVLGITAAFLVALLVAATHPLDLQSTLIVCAAATLGLFADSLLGATVERRGWLGNDLVNFSSTAVAATLAYTLARLLG